MSDTDDDARWRRACESILKAASDRGVEALQASPDELVVSSPSHTDAIMVTRAGEGDAVVRVGLTIRVRMDYLEDDPRHGVDLVDFVEGVLDGGAAEGAVLTESGAWETVTWRVRTPSGSRSHNPQYADRSTVAWRHIPSWGRPPSR